MKKAAFLMVGVCAIALGTGAAQAQTATTTTTTEIESPDGTTTTVVVPSGSGSGATVTSGGTAKTDIVITPRPAVDAITGEPASRSTAQPKEESEESLRDRVRKKMD